MPLTAAEALRQLVTMKTPSLAKLQALAAQLDLSVPEGKTIAFYSGDLKSSDLSVPGQPKMTFKVKSGKVAVELAKQGDFAFIDGKGLEEFLSSVDDYNALRDAVPASDLERMKRHWWADMLNPQASPDWAPTFGGEYGRRSSCRDDSSAAQTVRNLGYMPITGPATP